MNRSRVLLWLQSSIPRLKKVSRRGMLSSDLFPLTRMVCFTVNESPPGSPRASDGKASVRSRSKTAASSIDNGPVHSTDETKPQDIVNVGEGNSVRASPRPKSCPSSNRAASESSLGSDLDDEVDVMEVEGNGAGSVQDENREETPSRGTKRKRKGERSGASGSLLAEG
jgi:hypothetical protein